MDRFPQFFLFFFFLFLLPYFLMLESFPRCPEPPGHRQHLRARGQAHANGHWLPSATQRENGLARLRLDPALSFCASLRKTFQLEESGDSERLKDAKDGSSLLSTQFGIFAFDRQGIIGKKPWYFFSTECSLESLFPFHAPSGQWLIIIKFIAG